MAKEILFRPQDDEIDTWLRQNAVANNRSKSEELRAAVSIYRDLVELAHLRAVTPTPGQEHVLDELERRLKDDLGRVLLAAITDSARSQFETDAQVEYPGDRFGHVATPYDELIGWIATGRPQE